MRYYQDGIWTILLNNSGKTSRRRKIPPVAVIGCGYWGKNLVRNFYHLGALAMVCDTTEAGRAAAAQIAPDVPVVASLDEVTTGAVVIATPAVTHFDLARQALETGRDVFVEKPLALTYAQGARLVQLAREQRRILMVGHVLEYHLRWCASSTWCAAARLETSTTSTPTA